MQKDAQQAPHKPDNREKQALAPCGGVHHRIIAKRTALQAVTLPFETIYRKGKWG